MSYLTLRWLRIVLLVALVAAMLLPATGKRQKGCASFGHACYGGHGKRSILPPLERSSGLSGLEQLLLDRFQENLRNEEDLGRTGEFPDYLEDSDRNPPSYDDRKSSLLWKKLLLSSQQKELNDLLAAMEDDEA